MQKAPLVRRRRGAGGALYPLDFANVKRAAPAGIPRRSRRIAMAGPDRAVVSMRQAFWYGILAPPESVRRGNFHAAEVTMR